ncbi:hypothetical protein Emed_006039 [Eimeria media]
MVYVRQLLAACTVAFTLAEAALDSKEDLPSGAAQVEEKAVAESEVFKADEGASGESFADANRDNDNTVEPISPMNELVLNDLPSPMSAGARPFPAGRGRVMRRQTSQGGGGLGARKLPVGIPMGAAFEQHPGSPTSSSNRVFGKLHPPHDPPKRGLPRSAIMTLLLVIAIAWLVKQVKTYRRAQANLGVMRDDLNQLLSQAERNRTVHDSTSSGTQLPSKTSAASSSSSASGQTHGTEDEEDARNAQLVAEMQEARARLAELKQVLEEEQARLDQETKQDEEKQALPLTRQDALQEIARLEAEALRMQQQRRDLEALVKLREAIRKEEPTLQMHAFEVKRRSSSLQDPVGLYRTLQNFERTFEKAGKEVDAGQAYALKKRLEEALEDAKKTCVWDPALTEWSLLAEKEQLEEELNITRERGDPETSVMDAALSKLANVTTLASKSLFNSVSSLWKVMDVFLGGDGGQQEGEVDQAALEAERIKKEEEKLRENLEKLEDQVAAAEAELLTETQLALPLHAQDASYFGAWLWGKKEEARAAANFVVAGLNSLKAAKPLEGHASADANRAFNAAVESSINKATSALDHVK